ncbi:MAG TPA: hypothetical protein VGB75_10885 [Jatrophihabitans sp.]|jgi:hypothetical protein|uniref:hypothetical protein n=1 Tax=Jatrophihabitans sp. TaxID=1932789 RepID=UPI002EEC71E0
MADLHEWKLSEVIRAWEDDPGAPPTYRTPILRPQPDLQALPLALRIADLPPSQSGDQPGTVEFRYWAAADALRRAADFWGSLLGDDISWHPSVGDELTVTLDAGEDLNAYYDRAGLTFFHQSVSGITVYSGESPDVLCHETGHAVLDAIRPQLWDAASAEVAAFHESFADISALLSALQLDQMRVAVLAETNGHLARSSRLSRVAEQLGWAIRQISPTSVDRDCLRNAANHFFYRDPVMLPPDAPAAELSSAPHSFSRVFTGAFLRALAGIFRAQQNRDESGLKQASIDAGRLLEAGVAAAPIVPGYYAQVAAHMIAADHEMFGGGYGRALRSGFVRHGILSPSGATALTAAAVGEHALGIVGARTDRGEALERVLISGEAYGIAGEFSCRAPAQGLRFGVAGASPAIGSLAYGDAQRVAASFVEDLFRQGRVSVPEEHLTAEATMDAEAGIHTHQIIRADGGLTLARRAFD